MPRPCAVETHVRRYKYSCATLPDATALRRGDSRSPLQIQLHNSPRCHGLAQWSFTFAATNIAAQLSQMPRPCAVETHVRRYKYSCATLPDATALRRGVSHSPYKYSCATLPDATALRRGVSRSRLQKELRQLSQMPRPCAVEFHVQCSR